MTVKRIEINYKNYEPEDRQQLSGLDKTPDDLTLSEQDLIKLSSAQLSKIYDIYRNQRLDVNGSKIVSIDVERFKKEVALRSEDPMVHIRAKAKNNQFLMFGESHISSLTRSKMASFIPILKEEGFEYFTIEVDSNRQDEIDFYLQTGDRTTLADLTWMDEEFYEILDACKKNGLKVLCIDDWRYSGGNRDLVDQKMFDNIQNKILTDRPNAKVAIYIGKRHIEETKYFRDEKITDQTTITGFLSFLFKRALGQPTITGSLGFFLERLAPGKSHSINLIDRKFEFLELDALITSSPSSFALNVDLPFFFSIQSGPYYLKSTLGGNYDSLVVF